MDEFAGEQPVEEELAAVLRDSGGSLAIAEGCTGGLVTALVTRVPGASDYLERGVVPYSYNSNRTLLGVTRETLDHHGVVSGPVAEELAQRIRDTADATWGLSTTGIAGPGGGTRDRPIGTTYIGVAYAGPWESETSYSSWRHRDFSGDRDEIREQMARAALDALLEAIQTTDQ